MQFALLTLTVARLLSLHFLKRVLINLKFIVLALNKIFSSVPKFTSYRQICPFVNNTTASLVLTVLNFNLNLQFRPCTLSFSHPWPCLSVLNGPQHCASNSFRLLTTNSRPRTHLRMRTMMPRMNNDPETVAKMTATLHQTVAMTMKPASTASSVCGGDPARLRGLVVFLRTIPGHSTTATSCLTPSLRQRSSRVGGVSSYVKILDPLRDQEGCWNNPRRSRDGASSSDDNSKYRAGGSGPGPKRHAVASSVCC